MDGTNRVELRSLTSVVVRGLQLDVFAWDLSFAQAPVIARASGEERAETSFVRIRHLASGAEGWGEGCVDPYYGEIVESVAAVAPTLLEAGVRKNGSLQVESGSELVSFAEEGIGRGAEVLHAFSDAMDSTLAHNGAAKAALESAVHDLLARAAGVTLSAWFGIGRPQTPTDLTLWIDDPVRMGARAAVVAAGDIRYAALKLKVGLGGEEEVIRAVRESFAGPLRLDANCGWTLQRALALLPLLDSSGVELIEQPFPAGQLEDVAALAAATDIPIVADEDCIVLGDVDRLSDVYDGVNLKAVKIGGLGRLVRGFARAEALGLRRMFGCMTETRLGTAGFAALSGAAEFADLDGPIDLLNDPWSGIELTTQATWEGGLSALGSGVDLR